MPFIYTTQYASFTSLKTFTLMTIQDSVPLKSQTLTQTPNKITQPIKSKHPTQQQQQHT
jgi:hypothetical protein